MIVGSGRFTYRVNADWAKLPDDWSFKEVGGVGVDGNDNVYVFNRGDHPMMVFDRAGNFLRSWGEGQYPRAHGVHMAPDDTMFLTVPPLHPPGPLAKGRDLRLRRLRQRPRAQIFARRQIAAVMG